MKIKGQMSFIDEIIVDNFAGGGGASTGIELAAGRPVSIAVNHDPDAILMHKTNHPFTEHYQASVWDVDPATVCRGRPVGLAWFSPDCKHFSKAKGKALVDRKIRGLAWIVLRWAAKVRPRVIMLENVEEFQTWGPVRRGKPIKSKAGVTFNKWLSQLRDLGYEVEYRELVAADYGAPTSRKRFVLIARCDGRPIVFPKRTHAPKDHPDVVSGKLKPWRSAAEIIDWSLPTYSIFESKEEIKEKYGVTAVRPLADNTMRRIIRGVDKFTIKSGKPFIVPVGYRERKGQAPRVHDIDEPCPTVVSTVKANVCQPIVAPYIVTNNEGNAPHDVNDPLPTVTTGGRHILCEPKISAFTFSNTGESVGSDASDPVNTVRTAGGQWLAMPFLAQCNHKGDGHVTPVDDAVGTITAKHSEGIVMPFIAQAKFRNEPQSIEKPLTTITAVGAHELATPHIAKFYGGVIGEEADKPLPTVTSVDHNAVVSPCLIQYHSERSEKVRGQEVSKPLMTVDGSGRYGIAAAHLTQYFKGDHYHSPEDPLHTVTTMIREGITLSHIAEFKGQDKGQRADIPLRTITASDGEFGVVTTQVAKYEGDAKLGHWEKIRALLNQYCGYDLKDDEILLLIMQGVPYFIYDIGLRMLIPRELYSAQGFPDDYVIDHDYLGNEYKKTKQVARCGNAVCPPMAYAVVKANMPEWDEIVITNMAEFAEYVAAKA